jgi:hypothetical protein
MKKITLLISLIFGITNSYSQELNEGQDYPVVKGVGYQKLIGSDNTGFYVMKQSSVGKGVHIIIEKFNNNDITPLFSKETKVAEIQESMNFAPVTQIQTFLSKEKIFVFFESYNAKDNRLIFFLQTLSSIGELSEVLEISSTPLYLKNPIEIMGEMFFKVSFAPDGKSFSVITFFNEESIKKARKDGKKDIPEELICSIYDAATFKKIGDRKIPGKDQGSDIITGNYTIDNNENLFFSVIYKSDNQKKNVISGFAIGLIETSSPTVKMFPIALPDKKVFHDFAFKTLNDGDLLITGIVSDTLQKGVDSSVFLPTYFIKRIASGTLQTKYEQLKDFKFEAKMALGKAKKGTTFANTEILEMNNEVYIITQYTEIRYQRSSGSFAFLNEQTTNKELIVSKVDIDGNVAWTKVIPKLHIGGQLISGAPKPPRYSGNYKVFEANNKLNFVFLDHPENRNLSTDNFNANVIRPIHANMMGSESIIAKDKAVAVCVSIDSAGKSSKKVFLENIEDGVNYIALGNTVMISSKKLLLFLENRKTKVEKFATLNF